MRTHRGIDERSLAMARVIVARIDADASPALLDRARHTCQRWLSEQPGNLALLEWQQLLAQPWPTIRALLLDPGERGQRLRQSSPFCGILSQGERLALYKEHRDDA